MLIGALVEVKGLMGGVLAFTEIKDALILVHLNQMNVKDALL